MTILFFLIPHIFSIDGRVFVTIVRNNGVPSSLNIVSEQDLDGPLLQPYPDWTWTKRGDCDGITNVFGIAVNFFYSYLLFTFIRFYLFNILFIIHFLFLFLPFTFVFILIYLNTAYFLFIFIIIYILF